MSNHGITTLGPLGPCFKKLPSISPEEYKARILHTVKNVIEQIEEQPADQVMRTSGFDLEYHELGWQLNFFAIVSDLPLATDEEPKKLSDGNS